MTTLRPTLLVSRLIISKSGKAAYDEKFHLGLNVIRGKNSSGKTTITRALMYSLGYDLVDWTPELLSCDYVTAEVRFNGSVTTLKRPVSDEIRNHMKIYWGSYEESTKADDSMWEKYPYNSSPKKEGFTSRIFRALEIPQTRDANSNRITMHQILRMSYGDQSSSASAILGVENFDSGIKREAIGDLLLGVYDGDLFSAKSALLEAEKKFSACQSKLRSIYQLLGKSESTASLQEIDSELDDLKEKVEAKSKLVAELKATEISKIPSIDQKNLAITLGKLKSQLLDESESLKALELDITDSSFFVQELKHRLACLEDADGLAPTADSVPFAVCPCCSSDISSIERPNSSCQLCGSELKKNKNYINFQKISNELNLQLIESQLLLEEKLSRLPQLKASVKRIENEVKTTQRKYNDVATDISSEQQKALQAEYRELGYFERSIESLQQNRKLIEVISGIVSERDELNAIQNTLKDQIKALEAGKERRKREVYSRLSDNVANLLHKDLPRQDEFVNAGEVQVDFAANSAYVDGQNTFSESSTVFLKNAVLLAVLALSATDNEVRFPRFLVLDGIENGGMERERSHNLQKLALELSDSLEVDHQIILTTQTIAEELEKPAATVGRAYTKQSRSLEI